MKPKKKKPSAKDCFGSRIGTIASRVNLALGAGWKTDLEIEAATGIPLRQVRARLYHATKKGLLEHEKVLRYRVKTRVKAKKADKANDKRNG